MPNTIMETVYAWCYKIMGMTDVSKKYWECTGGGGGGGQRFRERRFVQH